MATPVSGLIEKVGGHGCSVAVLRRPGRANYYLRYWDRAARAPAYVSTRSKNLEDAQRAAIEFHAVLAERVGADAHTVCQPRPDPGIHDPWVYFIESPQNNLIKIGFSINPVRRFEALARESAVPLRLLGAMRGDMETESMLHDEFRRDWSHGEWFRGSDRLRVFIRLNAGSVHLSPPAASRPPEEAPK